MHACTRAHAAMHCRLIDAALQQGIGLAVLDVSVDENMGRDGLPIIYGDFTQGSATMRVTELLIC